MKTIHFLVGCVLGFGLATSSVAFLFCTFLCGKAALALMTDPSLSLELIRSQPVLFRPLLRIVFAEIFLVVLLALLFMAYRKYMGQSVAKKHRKEFVESE